MPICIRIYSFMKWCLWPPPMKFQLCQQENNYNGSSLIIVMHSELIWVQKLQFIINFLNSLEHLSVCSFSDKIILKILEHRMSEYVSTHWTRCGSWQQLVSILQSRIEVVSYPKRLQCNYFWVCVWL